MVPNCSSAPNSWVVSSISGYVRTSISTGSTLLPRWDWAVMIGRGSRIISKVVSGSVAAELSTRVVVFESVVVFDQSALVLPVEPMSFRPWASCSCVASSLLAGRSSCSFCVMGWEVVVHLPIPR